MPVHRRVTPSIKFADTHLYIWVGERHCERSVLPENTTQCPLAGLEPGPLDPGARFSKAPKRFRARKAVFRSSVSKNGEVYTPETSSMKGTSLHL